MDIINLPCASIPGKLTISIGTAPTTARVADKRNVIAEIDESASRAPLAGVRQVLDSFTKAGLQATPEPETVLQAVSTPNDRVSANTLTQRLSRETDAKCAQYEAVAKAVADSLSGSIDSVQILNSEHLDGASVRLLGRISYRLARDGAEVLFAFGKDPLAEPNADDLPARAVRGGWQRLTKAHSVRIERQQPADPLRRDGLVDTAPSNIRELHEALATPMTTLMDELAIALCASATKSQDGDLSAEAKRLLGTLCSNVDGFPNEHVEQLLLEAKNDARSPLTRSGVLYTLALFTTKRLGNLDRAESLFQEGIKVVADGAYSDTTQGRVSIAWHRNGLGLVEAMRAKASRSHDQAKAHFANALRQEVAALTLIRTDESDDAVYLRFNVGANVSLLQEMQGQVDAAAKTLSSLFRRLLDRGQNDRFHMTCSYRLGALAAKALNWNEAAQCFDSALAAGNAAEAEQALGRIMLALAVAHIGSGRLEDAGSAASLAVRDGAERADSGLVREVLGLALHALSKGYAGPWVEISATARATLGDDASNVAGALPGIASKLPSYVAMIDLMAAPSANLNQTLTGPTAYKGARQ